jgi:glycosyltransferase involved in cell wall biosynthesis
MMPAPKIAIVCDWITSMGGAEQVVLAMHEAFPEAPIYTSVYTPESMPAFNGMDIRTTWLQKLPRPLRKLYKWLPVFQVHAFRSLDLSEYDIILSSSIINSKQVRKTRPGQVHICYCHTPTRYYWSHYEEYKKDPSFGKLNWLVRPLIPLFVPHQRKLDYQAAQNVDVFIANSEEVQKRIKKYYKKSSTVIHPPVETDRFTPAQKRGDYYVVLGRQVPYKRYDLAVQAANKLGVALKVFGKGPVHEELVAMAGPTVSFYADRFKDASDDEVTKALNKAKGFIFTADEDFGIVQVEALAAGAPVIGYARGGTLDIVQDGVSGILFKKQTVEDVASAIKKAESLTFLPGTLRRKSKRFDKGLFINKIRKVVGDTITR